MAGPKSYSIHSWALAKLCLDQSLTDPVHVAET